MKRFQIITNNEKVKDEFESKYDIKYFDISYGEILDKVHFMIAEGYKLLSHPLSGSVKPNETPYKSIMLSKEKKEIDMGSLALIEKAIETYEKFPKINVKYKDNVIEDFKCVDYTLIKSAISSADINMWSVKFK